MRGPDLSYALNREKSLKLAEWLSESSEIHPVTNVKARYSRPIFLFAI